MENQRNNWYNTILNQLDKAAEDYNFPIFDNVNFPAAGMKIFTYCDDSEWLIAFESIVYARLGGVFLSLVSAFGNKLIRPGLQSDMEIIKAHKDYAIWDEEYNYILTENEFLIYIRNELVEVSFTNLDYENSGVNKFPNMEPELRMLRILWYKYSYKFRSNQSEILIRINKINIPLFLEIDQWNHPLLIGKNKTVPSQSECFKSLAQALTSGDPESFRCTKPYNSNWQYWEEYSYF